MSSKIYNDAQAKAKEDAADCEITDSMEIRKMTCQNLQASMKEVGSDLVESINTIGSDVQEAVIKGFLEGVNSSHRYLQGEFWGVMVKIIKEYGEKEHFDARNEWAVQMCKRMAIAGEDPGTAELLFSHKNRYKY